MRLVQELCYCYHYEVGQHDANAWFWQIATSAHNNVFLLQERIVDDMYNAIGALNIWPIYIDLLIIPHEHISWNEIVKRVKRFRLAFPVKV